MFSEWLSKVVCCQSQVRLFIENGRFDLLPFPNLNDSHSEGLCINMWCCPASLLLSGNLSLWCFITWRPRAVHAASALCLIFLSVARHTAAQMVFGLTSFVSARWNDGESKLCCACFCLSVFCQVSFHSFYFILLLCDLKCCIFNSDLLQFLVNSREKTTKPSTRCHERWISASISIVTYINL